MAADTFTISQYRAKDRRYLYPINPGWVTEMSAYPGTGEENYEDVDDVRTACDFASSYVYNNTAATKADMYGLDPSELYGLDSIDYVRLFFRGRLNGSAIPSDYYCKVQLSDDPDNTYQTDALRLTNGFNVFSYKWTENPRTSAAWELDDLARLQFGFEADGDTVTGENTEILRPSSCSVCQLHCATPPNWSAVRDNDSDTVYTFSDTQYDSYGLDNTVDVPVGAVILNVTVHGFYYASHPSGNYSCRGLVEPGCAGTKYYGNTRVITSTDSVNPDHFSWSWPINPATYLAWTKADLDALCAGTELVSSSYSVHCKYLYVVVEHTSTPTAIAPIECTQLYAEIGGTSSPSCYLPRPEEISRSHRRNVQMLNFWDGSREVYDLKRSNKGMVLKGKVWPEDCEETKEVTGYFSSVESVNTTYHTERVVNDDLDDHTVDWFGMYLSDLTVYNPAVIMDKDCAGLSIDKVEVRCKVDLQSGDSACLVPQFSAGAGDSHCHSSPTGVITTDWYDITSDTNAPATWTYDDILRLGMRLTIVSTPPATPASEMYWVQLRVTYKCDPCDPCGRMRCVRDMGRDGSKVSLSGLGLNCYNGDYYIQSFGWAKRSARPEVYEWILELEDAE